MLEQAIVDANALKEAAIKNAESAIIERYSKDIKEAVNHLLEQPEDLGMPELEPEAPAETDFTKQVPHAAVEGEEACPCPEEDVPIEIDFDDLQARLSAEEEGLSGEEMVGREGELAPELAPEEETEISLQESILYDILSESDGLALGEAEIDELLEDLLAEDEEELELEGMLEPKDEPEEEKKDKDEEPSTHTAKDLGFQKGTPYKRDKLKEKKADKDYDGDGEVESSEEEWKGSRDKAIKKATQKENKIVKENKQLLKSVGTQKEQIKTLKEQNNKYRSLVSTMKEKLDEVNLSNAKLLYTNRILTSDSQNERQKNKIVEAVRSAKTVE